MKKIYRLGDIANISAGQGAPQKESDFSDVGNPFIRAGNLAKLIEGYSEYDVCELINDDTAKRYGLRLYPKDTIVFAKSGKSTSKGYVHILSQECYIVNHLACINIYNNDSSYMKYYFMYHKPNRLIKDEAYPSISLADIRDMKINIHDIQTQKEIVAVLDKVTSLISMRKKQLDKLDVLVKSKFIEMFGDPVLNPKGWEKKKLGEVCEINPNKDIFKSVEDNTEISFIPMENVSINGYIDTSIIKKYDDVKNGYSYFIENDVLFAKITPSMENGKGAVAKNLKNGLGVGSTEFHILRPKINYINSVWLYNLTHFRWFRLLAEKKMTGSAGQKRVPAIFLKNFITIIPPLDLQNQFAEFVEQVEKNKENIKSSLNQLETLYSALMQEYFG